MASYVTTFDDADKKVHLAELSTEPPKEVTRESAALLFSQFGAELFELQDLLWGARTHSVLIVLQGMDCAGKDGAIKHVAGYLNPRGVSVSSFGVPTREELEHDFLWRVHQRTPRKGEWTLFNRSHYEDVLVVRVENLIPEAQWKERYGHIRDFEELLSEHDTIIFKFFLHISRDEQKKRLLEREQDEHAAWKLNAGDWKARQKWDEYRDAYQDAIRRCASPSAPWHIVPADSKWFRNLAIAATIVEKLRPYKKLWRQKLDELGGRARAELAAYRADGGH